MHCQIPLRYGTLSTYWLENINPIPFEDTRQNLRVRTPSIFGSTNPCSTADHMEPFITLVFKACIIVVAMTTKIRTTPSYWLLHRVTTMIDFRSRAKAKSIQQVNGHTHSLADVNFHVHCPPVKMNQLPLWYLMSEHSRTFTQ